MNRPKMLYRITAAAVIVLAGVLAANITLTFAAGKEAKIGLALSMTGAAAAYGSTQKNSVQLAADEINAAAGSEGLKVTPIFDDDASVPQHGINVFNKFTIARGLMAHPKLLLDEPSLSLAPKLVSTVFEIIRELLDEGQTILLVEQNARQSLGVSSYAYVIESGSIVLEGPSEGLRSDPDVIRSYLGQAV